MSEIERFGLDARELESGSLLRRLEAVIAGLGWTNKKVAQECGVTVRAINRWLALERGVPEVVVKYLELRLHGDEARERAEYDRLRKKFEGK